jgi:hypothetical protein
MKEETSSDLKRGCPSNTLRLGVDELDARRHVLIFQTRSKYLRRVGFRRHSKLRNYSVNKCK